MQRLKLILVRDNWENDTLLIEEEDFDAEDYTKVDEPIRLYHYVEYIKSDLENWNYHREMGIVDNIIGDISAVWGDEDRVLQMVKNWAEERTWIP